MFPAVLPASDVGERLRRPDAVSGAECARFDTCVGLQRHQPDHLRGEQSPISRRLQQTVQHHQVKRRVFGFATVFRKLTEVPDRKERPVGER